MSAPESVVQAVMRTHRGARISHGVRSKPYCSLCYSLWDDVRGDCTFLLDRADAAFAASLEWAAERLKGESERDYCDCCLDVHILRRWARGES